MVLATKNPIEYEGTFPLPEAQLDRFMVRIRLGYPTQAEEITIIERQERGHSIDTLGPVVGPGELVQAQEGVREVYVDPLVKQYIVSLAEASRKHEAVYLGASPRGSLALFRLSQARALLRGRDYVLPDDVKTLAEAALAHRLIVKPSARMREVTGTSVVQEILASQPVPGARSPAPAGR